MIMNELTNQFDVKCNTCDNCLLNVPMIGWEAVLSSHGWHTYEKAAGDEHTCPKCKSGAVSKDNAYEAHKKKCLEINELFVKKNTDYTGDNPDPFFTFKTAAKMAGISVEQAINWEIAKKLTRLRGLLDGNTPNYESMDDTLDDVQNYRIILKVWKDNSWNLVNSQEGKG